MQARMRGHRQHVWERATTPSAMFVRLHLHKQLWAHVRLGHGQSKPTRVTKDNFKMCWHVCVCACVWKEVAPTGIEQRQHASSDHFSSSISSDLMAERRPEVFIPNLVHNLMAFERLPLPPGWQVVHLDLIESIYILHKWKAHAGLPTWFWSATELGEPWILEHAHDSGDALDEEKVEGRKNTFWYYSWIKCNLVGLGLPRHVLLFGSLLRLCSVLPPGGVQDDTLSCVSCCGLWVLGASEKRWAIKLRIN